MKTASGAVVSGVVSAAEEAGSDLAIFLAKSDSLVLDTNGNLKADKTETVLAKVTGGAALLFLTDLDANGAYDDGDLTGLAFAGVFGGEVNGTVNGSIASLAGVDEEFSAVVITDASIKGLTVNGAVRGDVLAGGAVANASFGKAGDVGQGIGVVATGTATAGIEISLNGGNTFFAPEPFSPSENGAGPAISKLTILDSAATAIGGIRPAMQIRAGDGNGSGAGGDITDVTIAALNGALIIAAGNAGTPDAGNGGAGGDVAKVKITATGESSVEINAGTGADGSAIYFEPLIETVTKKVRSPYQDPYEPGVEYDYIDVEVLKRKAFAVAGAGGAGGAISDITLTALGGDFTQVTLNAGVGGSGSKIFVEAVVETVTKKVRSAEQDPYEPGVEYDYIDVEVVKSRAYTKEAGGGAGGVIARVTLEAIGGSFGPLTATAGGGGGAGGNKPGGVGGSIDKFTSTGPGTVERVDLFAGNGGGGSEEEEEAPGTVTGSKGGSVTNVALRSLASGLQIVAGAGSNGAGGGAGAAGGAIQSISAGLLDGAGVNLTAGNGGDGSLLIGQKKVRSLEQDPYEPGTEYDYVDAIFKSGAGGEGGSIGKITLTALEAEAGDALLTAGNGGAGGGAAAGGKAGGINGVGAAKNAPGHLLSLTLNAGDGGFGGTPVHGGSISSVRGAYSSLVASSGDAAEGSGGNGGDISGFTNLVVDSLQLVTAPGATTATNEESESGLLPLKVVKGGNGGNIKGIAAIVTGTASLATGNGADGSFIDGAKGTISKKVRSPYQDPYEPGVEYDYVDVEVVLYKPKAAAGGDGGKISGVTLTALGESPASFEFIAGNGGSNAGTSETFTDKNGDPLVLGVAGAGGVIDAIKILAKASPGIGDGSLGAIIATGGTGGDGSLKGGAGGSVKIIAEIAQTLASLSMTGGAGGSGAKPGAGGSLAGSVKAAVPFEAVLVPGDGDPLGKNTVTLTPAPIV